MNLSDGAIAIKVRACLFACEQLLRSGLSSVSGEEMTLVFEKVKHRATVHLKDPEAQSTGAGYVDYPVTDSSYKAFRLRPKFKEQEHRLMVWSANSKAQMIGTGSLDYKLRDAAFIRRQVVRLLTELEELLHYCIDICDGEVLPWEERPSAELDVAGGRENSSDDDEFYTELGQDMPGTELEQMLLHFKAIVDSLLSLNFTISDPAPRDGLSNRFHQSVGYEALYMKKITKRFPRLATEIAKQLMKSMARRRAYFDYRRQAYGHEIDKISEATRSVQTTTLSESLVEDRSRHNVSLNQDDVDDGSDATADSGDDQPDIPPRPAAGKGEAFRCSLCYSIIVANRFRDWK